MKIAYVSHLEFFRALNTLQTKIAIMTQNWNTYSTPSLIDLVHFVKMSRSGKKCSMVLMAQS